MYFTEQDLCPIPGISKDLLFFDLETTGLHADAASIYMMNCCHVDEAGGLQIEQWLSNSYPSEKALLLELSKCIKHHPVLVHYYGNRFQLPFLRKKYEQYGIDCPDFSKSIDLYKIIEAFKKQELLTNHKRDYLEKQLSFKRKEARKGAELIPLYSEYIQGQYLYHNNASKLCKLSNQLTILLTHGKDDLRSLLALLGFAIWDGTSLIPYYSYANEPKYNQSEQQLTLIFTLPAIIPIHKVVKSFIGNIEVHITNNASDRTLSEANLTIPVLKTTLKYYYQNYKDYYYLPLEDMAIHKSVGSFVEAGHRKKATARTCYCRRTGTFLPCLDQTASSSYPLLYTDYDSPQGYYELNETLLSDSCFLMKYGLQILHHMFL